MSKQIELSIYVSIPTFLFKYIKMELQDYMVWMCLSLNGIAKFIKNSCTFTSSRRYKQFLATVYLQFMKILC